MKPAIAKTLSLFALATLFPDEKSAVAFFEKRRWGDTPTCPRCGKQDSFRRPHRRGHRCNACRKDFTVRHGTVFESSRLPLRKWLFAMYLLQTARKSVSALQLSKELDVAYNSAWFMAHRIRAACSPADDLLTGRIEVDETFVGGKDLNRHESKKKRPGGGGRGKASVFGMKERGARGGRVRAFVVPDRAAATLTPIIERNVARGSVIISDDWPGYRGLERDTAFSHEVVDHAAREYVRGDFHTNGVEATWAVLKRSIGGTFHHVSAKHLGLYLNEVAFRLDEGNVEVDTIDRIGALVGASVGKRLTYEELTS